jgi:hypothetical protein
MSQDKQEQEFEAYLQGDSKLSTSYQKASSEQAPAHLDDSILAASRRAVQSKPRYAFSPFASDWHMPLSLAAVLVLSVSVIVTIQNDNDQVFQTAPTDYQPQTASESFNDGDSNLNAETDSSHLTDRLDEKESRSRKEKDSVISNEAVPAASSRIMKREAMTGDMSGKLMLEEEVISSAKKSLKTPSSTSTISSPERQSYAIPMAEIPQPGKQELIIKSDDNGRQAELKLIQQRIEPEIRRNAEPIKDKPARAKANVAALASADEFVANDSAVSGTGFARLESSPQDWLDLIKQLWQDDKNDEALRQLQLFSDSYPDYEEKELIQKLDPELIEKLKIR